MIKDGGSENQGHNREEFSTTAASDRISYSSSSDNSSSTTFIIKGRKRALREAYNRSLNVNHSCYCITGDELIKSYKPFLPLLHDQVFRRAGTSYIITNIEKETISAVKELTEAGAEIRHINISNLRRCVIYDDNVAYFSIVEPIITHTATDTVEQTEGEDIWVGSTELSIVQSAKKQFLSDWNKATVAKQRIREIEEGIVHYQTRIIEDSQDIIKEISRINASSDKLYTCLTSGGLQYSLRFLDVKKKLLEKQKVGKHQGIKCISNIGKDDTELVKVLLDAGIRIKHVKTLPPMNFGVSDKEITATIEKIEHGRPIQSLLLSNEPAYINHFISIFEELWNDGIDAEQRLNDIEQGVDLADIEVISSPARAQKRYLDIVETASEEILWIFPTTNSFIRQDKIGAITLAIQTAATRGRNVKVRILVPANRLVKQKVQQLKEYCSCHDSNANNTIIDVKYIEQMSETKATILVVDRKASLVMELRDDTKSTFCEAVGLSTYSNSKAGVLSYVAIFENLWKQSELYEKVKTTNEQLATAIEQLKVHDKIQREFINVAAHELRTPIQPILGLTQILEHGMKDTYQLELLNVVIRNAKRLKKLTEDILDVTKIESNLLQLRKEQVNLNELISNAITDYRSQLKKGNNDIRLLESVSSEEKDIFFIEADESRLNQVIINLLDNAVKFTEEHGTITISIERIGDSQILVAIKDTGIGIDSEILPRLFEKFISKSFQGTGLGLFISKSIVEAHGGKIWAKNNPDGIGATFTFTLPLQKAATTASVPPKIGSSFPL